MNLSFTLHKDFDFVFDYLTDMQKYVSVHPVIFRIDQTGDDSFLIHERLKLGFIPFSFSYPATVKKLSADTVHMRATVFRFTKIEMKFVLKSNTGVTTINEEIDFHSPLPVKFILQRIFRKQHAQLFRNIEEK